jgi:bifunctional enzyme CysN/CysC
MVEAGVVVLKAFISPFEAERRMARALFAIAEFAEIFLDVPLVIAEPRDLRGLYKKACNGQLPNFTGIDSSHEVSKNPVFHILADKEELDTILSFSLGKIIF